MYQSTGQVFTKSRFMRNNKTNMNNYSAMCITLPFFFNTPRNIWENVKVISGEYIQYPLLLLKSQAEVSLPKIAS